MTTNSKTDEILTIAQEECGEFVQVVSKVRRFGDGLENMKKLTQEAGDILCMIELMVEHGIITQDELDQAKNLKREKLKIWSSIFQEEVL